MDNIKNKMLGKNSKKNNNNNNNNKKSLLNKVKGSFSLNKVKGKTSLDMCNVSNYLFDIEKSVSSRTGMSPDLNSLMLRHPLYKTESNKNFVENYLKKFTLKYSKINGNIKFTLDCLSDKIESLYIPFNKVYKFDPKETDKNFTKYKQLMEEKKDPSFLEMNEKSKFESYKKEVKKVGIEKICEFIVEVIVKSCVHFDKIKKEKGKKSDIKTGFEYFLSKVDSNNVEMKMNSGSGELISMYKNLKNARSSNKVKYTEKNDTPQSKFDNFKNALIKKFNTSETKDMMEQIKTKKMLNKLDKEGDMAELAFDENKNSSYLFFVLGMLLFALLTKFNVFEADSLGVGGGFI